MAKRKGSRFSKDEEQHSKRLRSGRIIETLTSPHRITKEVVTASTPSNPRVKPFTSSKSTIKITRVIDNEDGLDETDLCSTSSHDSQAIVQKKALSDDTNMNRISADMGLVEKRSFQAQVLHENTSVSKAKLTRKTARGIVTTPYLLLFETNAICR